MRTLQTTGLQLFSDPVSFGRKKMAADKVAFHDLSFRLEDYSLLSIKPNNLLLFLATAVKKIFQNFYIYGPWNRIRYVNNRTFAVTKIREVSAR